MNRDVVVQSPATPMLQSLGIDAHTLIETAVSDAVAQRGAERLLHLAGEVYLGGSAFNAARIVALLNRDKALDLAFFGIAGTVDGSVPHRLALDNWGIATHGVTNSPLPPATCLAMVEPAGRTLLTDSGANAGIADWLRRNSADRAKAIAACDLIHITSYLDPAAPGLIAELLEAARTHNPRLVVSLDPGMAWIGPGGAGLDRLLRQAQLLHLNSEELTMLRGASGMADIGARLAPEWSIIARTHEGATIWSRTEDGQLRESRLPPHPLLDPGAVIDATGAGDTFCGAFLWSYAQNPAQPLKAAERGFALARHKVGMNGPLTAEAVEFVMTGLKNW
ncbi:carbohydrate kinase family protein [Devosia sp. CAU 1758]